MKRSVRGLAAEVLLEIDRGSFLKEAMDQVLNDEINRRNQEERKELPQVSASLNRLVRSVMEHQRSIDCIIEHCAGRPVRKIKPFVRSVLRQAAGELFYSREPADHAICHEAVRLVKQRKMQGLAGFTNAVVRKLAKIDPVEILPDSGESAEALAINDSVPTWLAERLIQDYGRKRAEEILESREDHEISFRVRGRIEEVTEGLQNRGISVTRSPLASNVIRLQGIGNPADLPEFQSGRLTVQDASSVLVGNLAEELLKGTDSPEILDLCAAPGGKSLHLCDIPGARVTACDVSPEKLERIRENAERLKPESLTLQINDATVFRPAWEAEYDLVLCDLPCSGIGLIHKKPDIRYRIREEDLQQLATLQRQILEQAMKYVKPDGYLIFSTCTVNRTENDENAAWLAERLTPCKINGEAGIQLFPEKGRSDGFFISAFQKGNHEEKHIELYKE